MGPAPSKTRSIRRQRDDKVAKEIQGPEAYQEMRFRAQIDKSLKALIDVLDTNRHPTYPGDFSHTYVF